MIYDRIDRLPLYAALIPLADAIAAGYAAGDPSRVPCEVRKKAYATKPDDARRYEVHNHTIDLMIASAGAEVVSLCRADELTPAEPLPGGADGYKLDGTPRGSHIRLEAGHFLAIFPGEAHMVAGRVDDAEGSIEKWVVKVPVDISITASL